MRNGKALIVAGLRVRYNGAGMSAIPEQWQRFVKYLGKIGGQVGQATYGLCWNPSRTGVGIDYLTGVEISSAADIPSEFTVATIPSQKYAVFSHREHVSRMRETLDAVAETWLPQAGHTVVRGVGAAPDFFERYSEEFNPQTGMGGMEIWIPIL